MSDIHGSLSAFEKAMDAYDREKAGLLLICGDYLNHGPRNAIPEGYDTKGLAAALNKVKSLVVGVRGNCDSEVDQMMLEFPVLAPYTTIMLPQNEAAGKGASCGGLQAEGVGFCCRRIFVHHGHLYTAEEAAKLNPAGTVIVSGHTHVPVLERFVLRAEASSVEPGPRSGKIGASGGDCAPAGAACCGGGRTEPGEKGSSEYILLNPGSVSIPKGGSEPGYAVIESLPDSMTIRLCSLDGKSLKVLEAC